MNSRSWMPSAQVRYLRVRLICIAAWMLSRRWVRLRLRNGGGSGRLPITIAMSVFVVLALLSGMYMSGFSHAGQMYDDVDDGTNAIAVAISDIQFGLNRGYVGYTAIQDVLQRGGFGTHPPAELGYEYPENLRAADLLQKTLNTALTTNVPKNANFGDHSLFSLEQAEIGMVDYYKISFYIFGYKVSSGYNFYFLLTLISALSYVIANYQNSSARSIVILVIGGGMLVINMKFFSDIAVNSVANPRFASTLCLLPALHIVVEMSTERRPAWWRMGLILVQATVLEISLGVRFSGLWTVLFVGTAAILRLLSMWAVAQRARLSAVATLPSHLARVGYRIWPALLLIISVVAYNDTVNSEMHPSYKLDEFIPGHLRYHSAVLGLSYNPAWGATVGAQYGGASGDTLGYLAGAMSMKEHYDVPESFFLSNLSQNYKFRLDDAASKLAFEDILFVHPWFVLQAYWIKLVLTFRFLSQGLESSICSPTGALITMVSIFAAILTGAGLSLRGLFDSGAVRRWGMLVMLMVGLLIFSFIPVLYAYPAPYVMADQYWVSSATMMALVAFAITGVGRLIVGRSARLS